MTVKSMKQIGHIIRFHRKQSGLSQAEVAKHSGVGKTVVFDIEKGKPTIQLNTLMKILHTLNISIDLISPLIDLYKKETENKND